MWPVSSLGPNCFTPDKYLIIPSETINAALWWCWKPTPISPLSGGLKVCPHGPSASAGRGQSDGQRWVGACSRRVLGFEMETQSSCLQRSWLVQTSGFCSRPILLFLNALSNGWVQHKLQLFLERSGALKWPQGSNEGNERKVIWF